MQMSALKPSSEQASAKFGLGRGAGRGKGINLEPWSPSHSLLTALPSAGTEVGQVHPPAMAMSPAHDTCSLGLYTNNNGIGTIG